MRKPCCERQDNNNKGAWTKQEDQKLIDYIRKHGKGCWRTLPQAAGLLRCGKSCRLRWINYLRPDLKRGNFAEDEEDLIIKLHALLGNRWSLIAGRLPGRTDNEVKNYWNSHLSRKLTNMGLDPNNHRLLGLQKQLAPNNNYHKISSTNSGANEIIISDEEASKVRGGLKCTDQQVSDAGSCLEDDVATSGRLLQLDLNLDLTIKCPIANNNVVVDDHNNNNNNNVNESKSASMEVSLAPTLSLFR